MSNRVRAAVSSLSRKIIQALLNENVINQYDIYDELTAYYSQPSGTITWPIRFLDMERLRDTVISDEQVKQFVECDVFKNPCYSYEQCLRLYLQWLKPIIGLMFPIPDVPDLNMEWNS